MKCPHCGYNESFHHHGFIEVEVRAYDDVGNPLFKTVYACPKCGIMFLDI